MDRHILLLGRKMFVIDEMLEKLQTDDLILHTGTSLGEVVQIMATENIHAVIMGAGLPLELRKQIVEHVFNVSKSTTLHMKDWDSGSQGMLPFVEGVLKGMDY